MHARAAPLLRLISSLGHETTVSSISLPYLDGAYIKTLYSLEEVTVKFNSVRRPGTD